MNTFSLSFLRDTLIKRNAFIYHGAGVAKGVGNETTNAQPYLDRLQNVITQDLEVCCSTVRFGDSESNRNFWGNMGLILSPKSPNSITFVSPSDAGTIPDPNNPGRRQITRLPITSDTLVNSIDSRPPQMANEWCVIEYDIIGIFVETPIQYLEDGNLHTIELNDVFQNFPGMRVYSFYYGELRELLPNCEWGNHVSIAELYPDHGSA